MRLASDAWAGRGWVQTYRFGKTKLIELLQITGAEMSHMRALITEDKARRRDRDRKRKERAAKGAIARDDWLTANSTTQERPWQAEGISRATWYRRQRTAADQK